MGLIPGARYAKIISKHYRATFFAAYRELRGKVVVHHAIPKEAFKRYPGIIPDSELHVLSNLRGIPKEINNDIHQSKIRRKWNQFFRENQVSTEQLLRDKAKEIDMEFGHLFQPPRSGSK